MIRQARRYVFEGMELVPGPLIPFVETNLRNALSDNWPKQVRERYSYVRLNENGQIDWDPAALFNVMDRFWNESFRTILPPTERAIVNELIDVRNNLSHHRPFTYDDARRALASMCRLMRSISANDVEAKLISIRNSIPEEALHRHGTEAGIGNDRNPAQAHNREKKEHNRVTTSAGTRAKVCPNCKHRNPTRAPFCEQPGCGVDMSSVEVTALDQVPLAPSVVASGSASRTNVNRDGTVRDEPDRRRAFLAFPWGEEEVKNLLFVGRDPDLSPLAARIEQAGLRWVSGKHAEVFLEDGRLYVRDVGSTNGTYLNGERIEPLQPFELANGDQVSFSRRLCVTIHQD